MLDARRLSALVCVAETGSLTAAAGQLGVTQPAISQQLRTLESEYGLSLVVRSGRGVRLTAAGELLAGRAAPILAALAGIEDELDALQRGETGLVRVASVPSALVRLVAPAMVTAAAADAGLQYQLEEVDFFGHGHRFESFASGDGDVLVAIAGMDSLDSPDLDVRPLFDVPLVALVPSGHDAANAGGVRPADIVEQGAILVADALPVLVSAAFPDLHTQPDQNTVVADVHGAAGLVRHGVGLAIAPRPEHDLGPDIAAVPLLPEASLPYVVATRRHFDANPAVDAAIEALTAQVGTLSN